MTDRRRTRVKICGLTRAEDVRLAADLGADAVGFVLWAGSPRGLSAGDAARISRGLPPYVARVGVFVNPTVDEVDSARRQIGLSLIQLHGRVDVEAYRPLGVGVVLATSLVADGELEAVASWPDDVTPIVDAHDPERHGGTGRTADWGRAAVLSARRPIVLAGGLTAENVGRGIRAVRPAAVDVSSGVETSPGVKDPDRLRAFIAAVQKVQEETR